jgi:hypothetical protein
MQSSPKNLIELEVIFSGSLGSPLEYPSVVISFIQLLRSKPVLSTSTLHAQRHPLYFSWQLLPPKMASVSVGIPTLSHFHDAQDRYEFRIR